MFQVSAATHVHSPLLIAATVVNWLVAFAWVFRTAETIRKLPCIPDLLAIPLEQLPPSATERALLAVIVPACNEQAAIANTLRSLLRQEGIALEIIAVDDRSVDHTGTIVDQMMAEFAAGASNGRVSLKVLHVLDLPEGWMGKQHALSRGVALTEAPYLLFTDGDIFFRPDTLRRAMQYMLAEKADHLVLLPTPMIQSVGEHIMLSALQVYSALAVRLWKIPDPNSKDRLGVGAFNLVRREAYEAIGGFAALRMEVLEDVRLGVEIKRHRLRQRVAFGTGLVTLHWATGLLGIVRNVTKNLFAGFQFQVWAVLLGCFLVSLLGIYPFIGFFGPVSMQVASIASLLSLATLYFLFRRQGGSSPVYVFFFPVATMFLVYAILRSMFVTLARGAVVWRGTSYPLKELRRLGGPLR